MTGDAVALAGAYLSATEAEAMAAILASGGHTVHALAAVGATRRGHAQELLAQAGIGHHDPARSAEILSAIAGAKSVLHDLTPVWTMPGEGSDSGRLTSEFHRIVAAARQSVVCATYNFEETSRMWNALSEASSQPGVSVTIYVDAAAADPAKVRAKLPKAAVYASGHTPRGTPIRSHAKFVIIDSRLVLLTSANFSYSAENLNIEFGLLIDDPTLATSIETTMAHHRTTLYHPL
jgi:phosphatidylserine/phosphatidylglycerophosphate/cardiolipin synthase-like enzyme